MTTTDTTTDYAIDELLSDGITSTPPSFVRAILKAASDPNVTSFAGGLPNPISFPQEKLLESMQRVVAERGAEAFQYSATAGIEGLRQWVADDVADDAHIGELVDVLEEIGRDERGGERSQAFRRAPFQERWRMICTL